MWTTSSHATTEARPLRSWTTLAETKAFAKAKDFAKSDEIRDKLAGQGITVKDTSDGPVWQYLR